MKDDDNIVRFTLRIDKDIFQKFRYIAEYNARSANRELEFYIKHRVMRFEEEHGEIIIKEDKED